ncbi:thioredoxin domain-containing protein [Botrimarina mediterranea]|uniref:Thioredoxin C-1 n=1 Tax=Botrimarina mediterranea TaxID=2528022 RepID=A0A518K555_9BACT|nr:thioredoxin domain-containing protein [Botrimarina mediterranea]QDV72932.1 Thioredoxin C-1 [Botrimarina mediterranea]QDV77505.1 Thioredoxin C-1 [Planctomycetes bacterium K2D]
MRARGTRSSLVLWLLAVCVSPVLAQSEGMAWRTDFQAARAEAQKTGKLLLVHFWTESCGPCKLLETRVFAQPQVAIAVANEYVPVKVNANESPEIAQAYGVTRVPTDVVVTAQGQLVHSFVSPSTPMEYVGVTSQVARAYRTQAGSAYAAAAAAAPAPGSTYASNNASTPTAPAQPQGAPSADNLYAASNPYAAQPQAMAPAEATAQQQAAPQQQLNPAAMAAQAPPQPPIQPQTPTQSPQSQQQPVVASATPQLPPGSPALGFEGFCPVTMKNEWRWAKGDIRWGAIHHGRTYLFASQEAQKAFLANPDAFSPVLSGSDPVAAVDKQQSVPGVREFAVEYEGRFYLFANEQSLEKFWSNPTAYAQGAQRVAAMPASSSFIR